MWIDYKIKRAIIQIRPEITVYTDLMNVSFDVKNLRFSTGSAVVLIGTRIVPCLFAHRKAMLHDHFASEIET